MKPSTSGFKSCWYMISPFLAFINDFLLRFTVYQHVNALAVQLRTMPHTSVVIPLSMSSVAVESVVQMIGNGIVYCMCLCLRPSAKLASLIFRGVKSFVQRITGVDPTHLTCNQPCYIMDYTYIYIINIATYILNGMMMLITFLIVLTMMFTLLLTPFVPIVLIVTVVVTLLIALSLIAVISQMIKSLSRALSTIKKTIGIILLTSTVRFYDSFAFYNNSYFDNYRKSHGNQRGRSTNG